MAQAIVDPAEIRRFAHNLKVFTGDVRGDLSSLHTQLLALGDTWRDQEHERFTQEFEQTVAVLEKFLEVAEQHVPFLMRKAERIEDYLTQRERMNPGADVQAIDALQDWHNAVCLFRDEALDALGSIGMEVRRAFDWIDEEAKAWHREAREAEQAVVQAKAELSQRRTPNFADRIPDTSVQEENLARAKARLRFAEDQMDVCRKWAVRLPKMISEDYEGPARRLNNFLEMDLPAAIAHLAARIEALHRYTQVQPDAAPPAPAAPEAVE